MLVYLKLEKKTFHSGPMTFTKHRKCDCFSVLAFVIIPTQLYAQYNDLNIAGLYLKFPVSFYVRASTISASQPIAYIDSQSQIQVHTDTD